MKNAINRYIVIALVIMTVSGGCKKDFLDAKPSTNVMQPLTLDHFESLMEGDVFTYSTSTLPILSADEYTYIDYPTWQSTRSSTERNAYIWAPNLFGGESNIKDWSAPYSAIFYANNVLAGMEKIEVTAANAARWQSIKGWALFARSYYFYDLARNFCKGYDGATANTDAGLPLKLRPEVDEIMPRATLAETYGQILRDLNTARILLGGSVPGVKKNHPSAVAAYALQARIFLSMRAYGKAELAADSCLSLYDKLMNYQNINSAELYVFDKSNDETIYTTATVPAYGVSTGIVNAYIHMDERLIRLYQPNDLRLKVYFRAVANGYIMGGNYVGQNIFPYTGLATDEIYLIKAECAARRADVAASLEKLNSLLSMRYPAGSFVPVTAATPQQALELVLTERRKELVWRGLRWSDLKRFNLEGAGILLERTLNGTRYTLPPNDPRYVFPIPDDEVSLSGIAQNIR